jgi:hypothetical protein
MVLVSMKKSDRTVDASVREPEAAENPPTGLVGNAGIGEKVPMLDTKRREFVALSAMEAWYHPSMA